MILPITHPLIKQAFFEYREFRKPDQKFCFADFSNKYKLTQVRDAKDSVVGFEITEAHYNWLNLRLSK